MASKTEINRLLRKIFNKKKEEIIQNRKIEEMRLQDEVNVLMTQASDDFHKDLNNGCFVFGKLYAGGLIPEISTAGFSGNFGAIDKVKDRISQVGKATSIRLSAPAGSEYYILYNKRAKLQKYNAYHEKITDPLIKELQEIFDSAEEKVILIGASSDEVQKAVTTLKNFAASEPETIKEEEEFDLPINQKITVQFVEVEQVHAG